jgi:putative ABC transport system ATP-binding protein
MVILDEPTSGLDSESKRKVINYFLNECASTVVAVTHDQEWMDNSDIKINLNNNDVERK